MRAAVRIFAVFVFLLAILLTLRVVIVRYPSLVPSRLKNIVRLPPVWRSHAAQSPFETTLQETFERLEVRGGDIVVRHFVEDSLKRYEVAVAQGRPWEWIVWDIASATTATAYEMDDCVYDERRETCTITFRSVKGRHPRIRVVLSRAERFFSTTAKMAVLIEGFDFQADKTTTDVLSFEYPLTISLDPSAKKSAWCAQAADQYKKEVLIQISLEPLVRTNSQRSSSMILVHDTEEKIREIIAGHARVIPNFSGFINVFGSRAMEDSRVMEIVLRDVQRRHGYFVESKSARSSVVPALVKKLGVPHAEIGARIHDGQTAKEIEEHLRHFCVVAQNRSRIIVAAKASPALIEALRDFLPVLTQNGVRLAYISEIVAHPKAK